MLLAKITVILSARVIPQIIKPMGILTPDRHTLLPVALNTLV
nr:MAG TPA: hypothetical protein [Caudoviricetes sp.]